MSKDEGNHDVADLLIKELGFLDPGSLSLDQIQSAIDKPLSHVGQMTRLVMTDRLRQRLPSDAFAQFESFLADGKEDEAFEIVASYYPTLESDEDEVRYQVWMDFVGDLKRQGTTLREWCGLPPN